MRVPLIFLLFPKLPLPVSPCLNLFCFLDLKKPNSTSSLSALQGPSLPVTPTPSPGQSQPATLPPQCPGAVRTIISIILEGPCEPGCTLVSGGRPTCPEAGRIIKRVTELVLDLSGLKVQRGQANHFRPHRIFLEHSLESPGSA